MIRMIISFFAAGKVTNAGSAERRPHLKYPVIFIALLLLILSGCSFNGTSRAQRVPEGTRSLLALSLPFNPGKVAYSSIDNTLFVSDPGNNQIHIYKNGRHINTIGGLGFAESNFNRLSDITVSPNGKLLALDSFRKIIKKFDSNGMWLENYEIRQLSEPLLFDVAHDGTVFVYDRTSNEIVIFDERIEEIIYRFGKFLVREPLQLTATSLHVSVYDKSTDQSLMFDSFGKLTETLDGYWQTDRFDNKYLLTTNKVHVPLTGKDLLLSAKPWHSFIVKNGMIHLVTGREINISEIVYERSE